MIGVVVALLGLPLGVAAPATAAAPLSWDLNPDTGRPYDFNEYTKTDGWQTDPTSAPKWGLWPLCKGTILSNGSTYSGGRSTFCVSAVDARAVDSTGWTQLVPTAATSALDAFRPTWSSDWSTENGARGVGGAMDVQVQYVGNWVGVAVQRSDKSNKTVMAYRITLDAGNFDFVAMKSAGSGASFVQRQGANGSNFATMTAVSDGAGSVIIPPPQTNYGACETNQATASSSDAWATVLYDKKSTPQLKGYDGGVVESDGYPIKDVYFPIFSTDTGKFSLRVCAPHLKADGSLNIGYYRLTLSPSMLHTMGYYIADSSGKVIEDARNLTQAELDALTAKVAKDFVLTSSEQADLEDSVTLIVDENGGLNVKLSATIHYSGPVMTVNRVGKAAWPATGSSAVGGYVTIGYQTGGSTDGNLIVELRTKAGKLVSKSTRKAKVVGRADVAVPKKTNPGVYVLKVYLARARAKGKTVTTPIQNLPVSVTKSG